ncbi:MAG: PKD domain-containing protein [Bacteroidaceae bacterium]|nr:PKD domain-containing protein [Bacteroidaceae bacterium]
MTKSFSTHLCVFIAGLLLCVTATAQVNYKMLPDYDYVPPVDWRLGVKNGNAGEASMFKAQGAKSPSFSVEAEEEELPDHWNNALFKHFPPYFYQSGPSCMCSSFTGYIFTHELNSYRDLDGYNPANQMAVFFGWLQTFTNSSKEEIETYNGCPNAIDYNGRTHSDNYGFQDWHSREGGWMQGYNRWYRAMFNRAQGFYTMPNNTGTEKGREDTKRWLYNHNGDTSFKSGGLCYIVVASNSCYPKIASTPANDPTGAVGKYYITGWKTEVDHAMTIIGWDDRIEFDLDENGVYGEKEKDEVGAWIVANSWGEGWENGGWVYVPYRYGGTIGKVTANNFWQPYVTYIRKDYVPQRTIKLKMDYSHRSELSLHVGISSDTAATAPQYTLPMYSFQQAGDGAEDKSGGAPEVPMLGKWVDGYHYEPMEFGYDLTTLSAGFDQSKPLKYFFTVKFHGGKGNGHLYNASILDYKLETENGIEIPFDIDTIQISQAASQGNTITVSVVVPGETINAPSNVRIVNNRLLWDAPQGSSLKVKHYTIYKNNIPTATAANTQYPIDDEEASYCVSAVFAYKKSTVESAKSEMARLPIKTPEGNNVSLSVNNGTLVIPNALPYALEQGTIEFWIKPHAIGRTNHRLGGTKEANFNFKVTPSGQAAAGWDAENMVNTSAKSIKEGVWTHVAMTVDHNNITLFINGMKKGTTRSITSSGIPALGDIVFGTEGNLLDADIDEFRIWSKARTQIEIYGNKDVAVKDPASQGDLICYLPMNIIEIAGEQRIQDFACNNHAYIVTGESSVDENTDILKGASFKMPLSIVVSDSVYSGQPTQLQATGSVNVVKWEWSTPGAKVASFSTRSPFVTYTKAGEYNVTLTGTDTDGNETIVEKTVKVSEAQLPIPEFELSTTSQATAQPITLINRTKSSNCKYVWSIEGQDDQYSQNANAVFEEPGTYDITLIATNGTGSASLTKTVNIYTAKPMSSFAVNPGNILLGETTYLEDKSTGKPDNWIWTLQNGKRYLQVDGQFSSLVPPAPGYYDVTLQTTNSAGSNIETQARTLCVSNADAKSGLCFVGGKEQLEFDRPFLALQSTFTLEWWMNPQVYYGTGGFDFGSMTADCTDKGVYTVTYKGRNYQVRDFFILNQWHHYAIAFNRGKVVFYRDGEVISSYSANSNYTAPSWAKTFTFGRTDNALHAYIDEMRLWKIELNQTQLHSVCNAPISNPTEIGNLCLYYDFNQNGGDVIDRSGHGLDARRLNFGPDGDAWIIEPGVFTLDFIGDIVKQDVTADYMTNYKAPFLYNNVKVMPGIYSAACELQTNTAQSTWIFKSPKKVTAQDYSSVYVDSNNSYVLSAESRSYGDLGEFYNRRLWQTVNLTPGHYRFSITQGRYFSPYLSQLVVCEGDSIVGNDKIETALASTYLSKNNSVEFDIAEDGTAISLGILYNLPITSSCQVDVKAFTLEKITSESQTADGVQSAYDAVDKGILDNISGTRGAIRVVSDNIIDLKIYTADGRCVFNEYVSGNKRIPLAPGIYVANGKKVKVD